MIFTGAILIQSLARGADFQAVVAESPYSSFETVALERMARVVPSPMARLIVTEAILYTRIRYRVDLRNARPDIAIRCAHVPVLLIHGLADNETSPEHSMRLAQVNPAFTKLWLVPGAQHTGAYAADPQHFESTVLNCFQ